MTLRQAQDPSTSSGHSKAPERVVIELPARRQGKMLNTALRGYGVVYHAGDSNRCPSCHGRSWLVGRTMAECASCHAALPIVTDGRDG